MNDMTLINSRTVVIEWGDCDPAGIVYYPRYFVFFDNSTVALFAAAGLQKYEMVKAFDIVGFPMVDTRARFILPSRWGETIAIESHISEWRRSSFDVKHRVLKDDELAIEAWETRVWAGRHPSDPERIKAQEIPEEVKARFG